MGKAQDSYLGAQRLSPALACLAHSFLNIVDILNFQNA